MQATIIFWAENVVMARQPLPSSRLEQRIASHVGLLQAYAPLSSTTRRMEAAAAGRSSSPPPAARGRRGSGSSSSSRRSRDGFDQQVPPYSPSPASSTPRDGFDQQVPPYSPSPASSTPPAPAPPFQPAASAPATPHSREALMMLKARELKALLRERGVDCSDCFEKEELVSRLLQAGRIG